ncbi:D-lyxose/D-mannose family sugar isomerase [candidate division KSB3 bacterium]|uniref:D-lyxose/D-mannose family sugar isomerase n=1 Tax=candidate division KSB3 bacterium TaxID=2044937 RepID=A0A9D5JSJ3_9BACT|nr:D-lyxose/D-mannose family sugar isomerase [candidate division KSB3 bacterium]MBD3323212.1 D-lyxose/D-mannose family sugar isomerase [candidate division KSB3 bacterium]
MITRKAFAAAQQRAAEMIRQAGVLITDEEQHRIEVADYSLDHLEQEGAEILTLIETERIGVRIIVLFPHQTLPEHWHPPVGVDPGKEESFRLVAGTLYLYVPGPDTLKQGHIPEGKDAYYTVRHEIVLHPAGQYTVKPGDKHWFQAGSEGAVMYTYATCTRDGLDGFSDPQGKRMTVFAD